MKFRIVTLKAPLTIERECIPYTSKISAEDVLHILRAGHVRWEGLGKWEVGHRVKGDRTYYGVEIDSTPDFNEYGEVAP